MTENLEAIFSSALEDRQRRFALRGLKPAKPVPEGFAKEVVASIPEDAPLGTIIDIMERAIAAHYPGRVR